MSKPGRHRKEWLGAPEGFFAAEASGLAWLAEAGDAGGARVARVLDVGADFIELEQVATAPATPEAAERFGRELAATHAAGAPAFGAPPPGWVGPAWIGRQGQDNRPEPSWGRFYAEQRVRPFVHAAARVGHVDVAAARRLDRLCDSIARGDFDDGRAPARIHGDLWAGNVLHSARGVVLIDPPRTGGTASPTWRCWRSSGPQVSTAPWPPTLRPQAWLPAGGTCSACTSCIRWPSMPSRTAPPMARPSWTPPARTNELPQGRPGRFGRAAGCRLLLSGCPCGPSVFRSTLSSQSTMVGSSRHDLVERAQ